MKYLMLCLFLISCSKEPSEKESPLPTLPPQEVPKPQPLPPDVSWPKPVPLPPENPIAEKNVYLKFHNEKRCWHNVGNLLWDESLAASSKRHAERCVFAHDATANAGENLAIGYPKDELAMKAWYNEVSLYQGDWSPSVGHFTQMVWKGTTQIGCATARCPQGRFLVCRYLPAGNVLNQFQSNVLPVRSDKSQC